MDSSLTKLQSWYNANCDGVWERQHGLHIATVAEGRWWIRINSGTSRISHLRTHWETQSKFKASFYDDFIVGLCDPLDLSDWLQVFLDSWAFADEQIAKNK